MKTLSKKKFQGLERALSILLLSATMLCMLCCCDDVDPLANTYWRDNATGDWLIGVTDNKVIYDCKVWDVVTSADADGARNIQVACGTEQLDIRIGDTQDLRQRTITIGQKQYDCSLIIGRYLSDYPERDTQPLADNNYREGDSVTIIGWIKPWPEAVGKVAGMFGKNPDLKLVEAGVNITSILTRDNRRFSAPIDSMGLFTLRVPVENTTTLTLWCSNGSRARTALVVAEPNETYFMLDDPMARKLLFMGKNARLQNEANAHRIETKHYNMFAYREMGGLEPFLDSIGQQTESKMLEVADVCQQHPTISDKWRTFVCNSVCMANAHYLAQVVHLMPEYVLPEAYARAIRETYRPQMNAPFTLSSDNAVSFFCDYSQHLQNKEAGKTKHTLRETMASAERDGIIRLSANDRAAIAQYDAAWPAFQERRMNASSDSLLRVIDAEFEQKPFLRVIDEITSRKGYADYSREKFAMRGLEVLLREMDAEGWSQSAKDLCFCNELHMWYPAAYRPLSKRVLSWMDANIQMPAARNSIR